MVRVTWAQVVAWRMRQQWVDPLGDVTAVDVVRRLCGLQAQVPSAANLGVAVRQKKPDPNGLHEALSDRKLVRTWAMRGTLHALMPDEAGAFLSLVGAARQWEKGAWVKTFGVKPDEMVDLTAAVGEILHGRTLTRDELVEEVGQRLRRPDLEAELRSGWGAVLKPIAWQGQLCHGPSQGNRVTFTHPATWLPDWAGVPAPEEAARTAVPAYLRAYGPASPETFDAWVTRGISKKARLRSWFTDLGDELATVEVDDQRLYLRAEDVDDLAATEPTTADTVRLLPAFDQYVLGPGTNAAEVVPAQHRGDVSRTGGWISPVVVAAGRVVGVWEVKDDAVDVRLFDDTESPPSPKALDAEVERVAQLARRTPDEESG